MRATSVPQALREHLGREASMGLIEYVGAEQSEWSDRVLNIAVERFERRLAEQIGELRTTLVREIHETRSDTLKWTFLSWASQLTAFVGLLIFIFRHGAR
jgi:hypothetical protein